MNLPTKLTVLRIILIPVFVAVFFIDFSANRIVACAIFAVACLTDFVDGYLARKWHQVTTLGKFLDPIADKMLVACALIAIIPDSSDPAIFQLLIAVFAMIILCRELMVSCFRIVAASQNVVLAADIWGKAKTVFQMLALIVLLPYKSLAQLIDNGTVGNVIYYCGFALLTIATLLTIISGANYILKNKKVLFKNDDDRKTGDSH